METSDIRIRKAQLQDQNHIFWLLHSASISWNMEQIKTNINSLYVMTGGENLIGVAYNNLPGGLADICWTAIHPMYPEKALSNIFDNSIMLLARNLNTQ